jgi:hypothetical protein
MSCDKLTYDLSQEVEGSPNIFIRKDWINILDNQTQNYQNNQSIIDTSQLSNSNKYMGYREAYLAVPMLLTMKTSPTTAAYSQYGESIGDFSIGLKNWFGSIIHSLTLDYNGTTIIQQTPFANMWNAFKLMTTLSYNDILTQGPTIGFYPDTSDSWAWLDAYLNTGGLHTNQFGLNVCNNTLEGALLEVDGDNLSPWGTNQYRQYGGSSIGGNLGLSTRTKWIAYNPAAGIQNGSYVGINATGRPYGIWNASQLSGAASPAKERNPYVGRPSGALQQIWTSNVCNKTDPTTPGAYATYAVNTPLNFQIAVMATIYLKHIHSFFNMCPLLKGVFMKLTLNLNNASASVTMDATVNNTAGFSSYTSTVPVGGVQPLMIPSLKSGLLWITDGTVNSPVVTAGQPSTIYYNISVGSVCLDQTIATLTSSTNINGTMTGNLSKSVYLYVPAYTFNPPFEQAYLSNNIKQIKYTDIYQYQVATAIPPNNNFNNLITNGIANIKSVLIIPFFKQGYSNNLGGAKMEDYNQYQSPFDPAGTGPTAPMVSLGNFNVQISGQNAIYNTQRYTFEQFNNQLYGENAVNGGLTDGLTSGLVDYNDFLHTYGYYYVNVERMLPVEQSVPKSVQILGTNYSSQPIQLWVFIEYGVEISIDVLTGARV